MTSDRRLRAPWWLLLGLAIAIVLEAITVFGTQSSAESDAALKIPFSPTLQIAAAGGWAIALSYLLVD
ncbi:MAG TPA: hypothetical protein VMT34_17560, partial [Aggregatilineales bacterium]|nr:hypothetical protein [Aggregatilineales bacterium]